MSSHQSTTTADVSEMVTGGVQELWNPRYWLKNPAFDLMFVTGGAFFTLLVAALAFSEPTFMPYILWIWIIAFEGSHFWATFSRTYIDKKYRSENSKVLFGSLVFFAFPGLAVLADSLQSDVSYMTLYGFFIFVWSLYHNAKQHYGFLSIYTGKAKVPEALKAKMVHLLFWGVGVAQVYFLFNFKSQLVFGLPSVSEMGGSLGFLLGTVPMLISLALFIKLVFLAKEAVGIVGGKALIGLYYVATCLIFYSTMFYFIAPKDLIFQNLTGAETLMLIAVMNSLFHNIQYHAIVWYYGNKRFNEQSAENKGYGVARFVNYKLANYMGFSLLMGLVFGFIVWNVGDWPAPTGSWHGVQSHSWAYILFFGIIGHHFYLDQKIWRPSKSKELRGYLNLEKGHR
ncbi:MAG: hypothetical protein CL677_09830 [Bdellovibrionaceae bacterium]|nr:hypothetical protein [Pseudobdellovibrionaceae bacterium]|tara:strand:+ start:28244 stop:29437 length:1194 start_codon:yes stop_codon:yes gene_type:complete